MGFSNASTQKKKKLFTVCLSQFPQAPFYHILKSLPQHNKTQTSTSYSPPPNSMPENQWSEVIHKINEPLLSPSVLVRGVLAHANRRLLPIQVTGICKSARCLRATQVFKQSSRQLFQLFVRIVATVCSFILAMLWRASLGRNAFSWCSTESVAPQPCLQQIPISVSSLLLTTIVLL